MTCKPAQITQRCVVCGQPITDWAGMQRPWNYVRHWNRCLARLMDSIGPIITEEGKVIRGPIQTGMEGTL